MTHDLWRQPKFIDRLISNREMLQDCGGLTETNWRRRPNVRQLILTLGAKQFLSLTEITRSPLDVLGPG